MAMKILFIQSLRLTAVCTVLTGLVYPLAITGVAQLAFRRAANGSLLDRGGKPVGSELLAQKFESPRYFWPRPSAGDYATAPSGASNFGPTSAALQSNVVARARAFLAANPPPTPAKPGADLCLVPADMVFASGSGLDPHISPEAAHAQVKRVAAARGLDPKHVAALAERFIEPPQFGILGEPRVNVLRLNLTLDELR
jgi:K+-transporting ATPase ATPase C chain